VGGAEEGQWLDPVPRRSANRQRRQSAASYRWSFRSATASQTRPGVELGNLYRLYRCLPPVAESAPNSAEEEQNMLYLALALMLGVLATASGPAAAATLAISTFDTDIEGWTLQNDATGPFYEATGGNPGGHLRAVDLAIGETWRWSAPAKFLGDKSAAFGGLLTYDLSQSGLGTTFVASEVILVDTGPTPDLILVFNTGPDPAFFPEWSSYVVALDANAGWQVDSLAGPLATDAQLLAVLSSLDRLLIRGEFLSNPVGDVGRLDNVSLQSVPEPSTGLLVLSALGIALSFLGVSALKQRRHRRVAGSAVGLGERLP
jgi:Laminin B (Domain IV)